MVEQSRDPNDPRHFFDQLEYPRVKIRPLGRDLQKLSESLDGLTEEVIKLAQDLQTTNDVLFDVGDVIFHPKTRQIYEVNKVFDNSKRANLILGRINLECRNANGEFVILDAFTVLHFGYLLDAKGDWESTLEFSKALTAWLATMVSIIRDEGQESAEDDDDELKVDMGAAWQSAKASQVEDQLKTETQLKEDDIVIVEGDEYAYSFVGIDVNTGLAVLTRPGIKENDEPDEVIKNIEFTEVVRLSNMQLAMAMNSNRNVHIIPNLPKEKNQNEE